MNIARILGTAALLAFVIGAAAPAQAAPIVSLAPSSVTVNTSLEDEVTLDVLVTGLTEEIGGYSLDIVWNAAVMDWIVIETNPGPIFGPGFFLDPYSLVQGNVGILIAGDPIPPNTGLTDPLKILSITFRGSGLEGQTNVDLANVHLSKKDGATDIADVSAVGGVVCFQRLGDETPAIIPNAESCVRSVPEPMALSLLAAGLAGAMVRRRASKRS